MSEYNPFDKEISQLDKSDLNKLIEKEVAEGWYIEYKENFPSSNKIGHSIAAFANSDGGWYIVGIKANQDNVAELINGFDLITNRNPKEKIRDIIKTHISPVPFFESKLIELSDNRAILLIHVERGTNPPYITRDGKIYQRVGEGSYPIPLIDHYSIQKLFERTNEFANRINMFSQNPFTMSELQSNQRHCFLEAYFMTFPLDSFYFSNFYTKEFFSETKEVFSTPVPFILKDITSQIGFNSSYSSVDSYILRHTTYDNSVDFGLTVEIFENGNAKIFIPTSNLPSSMGHLLVFKDSIHFNKFLKLILQESQFIRVIDGYHLFISFVTLFSQYYNLLRNHEFNNDLLVRFRITESWRTLLYFDNEQYLSFIEKSGIPLCLKSELELPEFYKGKGIHVENPDQNSSFSLVGYLFEALGFPISAIPETMYGLGKYIVGLSKTKIQEIQTSD